jgi:pimeloyl-ACP methyl ester carboxylesterase
MPIFRPGRYLRVPLLALLVAAAALPGAATTPADGRTVKLGEAELYYRDIGRGEPLLLLHSGTQSSQMWDKFVDAFSGRYRLIIPDLRGHGGSTNPQGIWSTHQFADDTVALLDHLGIEHVRAVGASAGGMTLLRMATRQPSRIRAMILIGVGTSIPPACGRQLAAVTTDGLPEPAWESLRARHRHGDDQIRALYAWVASLADNPSDMNFQLPELATISVPTLIIHGDRDYCFPAAMAVEVYTAIPAAALWVVPNGGHVPISGADAGRFTDIALEFLESAGSSG